MENKNGQAPFIAPLNLLPLLRSRPGGVQKELVVKDLPVTKVTKFVSLYTQNATYEEFGHFLIYVSDYQLKWFFEDYYVIIALYSNKNVKYDITIFSIYAVFYLKFYNKPLFSVTFFKPIAIIVSD